ncbi:hypothetical protein EC968_003468 [Mortierella alpina]|nr:hypothetical protein EC968_003468 [Mortierella alpina]
MIHPPTQMLELSNGRETTPTNDLVATASIDLLSNIQDLAEQISHDEIGDAVGNLSLSRGDILAGFKDTRARAESNETVHNSPSGSPGLSPDLKCLATPRMAADTRYYSEPMTRQPSETSSVSTLQAGGSEDEIAPTASLKASLGPQQKVLATRALELPTDRRRPAEFSSDGAEVRFLLETPLRQLLVRLGHDSGSRLATIVLAAWSILLSRLSGEDSFVVGLGQVNELGVSTKALAVHVDLSGDPNTVQLLERVKHAFAVAAVRSSAKVEETAALTDDEEGHPFQVALYEHSGGFSQPPADHVFVKRDLELHLLQDKEDAAMSIRYASALYNEDTVERYAGYLKAILSNMVARGDQSVATFDIMSPAEKSLVLETWNESATEFPADRCIHQLFEEQVKGSPEAIAIVHDKQTLTYLELNAAADRLAYQLFQAGVNRGDRVAFLLYKSVELVVTQLAVLKVGAAYVPIDPKAPVERQAFIAKDSAAVLLVTDTATEIPSQLDLPLLRFGY